MPVNPTYPGVYVQEIPSGVRTITGVATSITAFIGRAPRGPVNEAKTITSYSDFERTFGGLWSESMLGFAVRDFFLNGGSQAVIVRLFNPLYKDDDDRTKAKEAANQIVQAIDGTADATPDVIKKAAEDKAKEINDDSQSSNAVKEAADFVLARVETAAGVAGTSKEKISKAATAAVVEATPVTKAKFTVGGLPLVAAYEGEWGASLVPSIDFDVSADVATAMGLTKDNLFNLTVKDGSNGRNEQFRNLSLKNNSSRRIDKVLEAESKLVRWGGANLPADADKTNLDNAKKSLPPNKKQLDKDLTDEERAVKTKQEALNKAQNDLDKAIKDNRPEAEKQALQEAVTHAKEQLTAAEAQLALIRVTDGRVITTNDFIATGNDVNKLGLYALEQVDLFNILCIPPFVPNGDGFDIDPTLLEDAAKYCSDRRAILLVDPPSNWTDKDTAVARIGDLIGPIGSNNAKNAALFFPRIKRPNPLHDNRIEEFAPSGVIAGIFARTDTQRGVWKAPAGLEAGITGAFGLSVSLTDGENGLLNPLAINCLRTFPAAGTVVWGARTLQGDDRLASEWKYIPVRRTALYIEESLFRGLKWVVFEPNDEPLWAQIRLNVGAFMHNLFRKGAFQGKTPRDAYFVKCDNETTTQNDIDLGIVNIVVGFAPLKPAEFVIISIQQIAGQIEV